MPAVPAFSGATCLKKQNGNSIYITSLYEWSLTRYHLNHIPTRKQSHWYPPPFNTMCLKSQELCHISHYIKKLKPKHVSTTDIMNDNLTQRFPPFFKCFQYLPRMWISNGTFHLTAVLHVMFLKIKIIFPQQNSTHILYNLWIDVRLCDCSYKKLQYVQHPTLSDYDVTHSTKSLNMTTWSI